MCVSSPNPPTLTIQAILERLNNQMLQMPGPGEFEQLVEDNGEANGHVNGTTDNYEDAD